MNGNKIVVVISWVCADRLVKSSVHSCAGPETYLDTVYPQSYITGAGYITTGQLITFLFVHKSDCSNMVIML